MEKEKENLGYTFKEYINKSKVEILIIVLFMLCAFGGRLISNSFSIDVEVYIKHLFDNVNWDWWLTLNRWGLVFLNKIFQIDGFPIFATNFITVITMIAYSIAFNYLFYINIKDEYKEKFLKFQFIFPIIFFTNPIFAEQYNFINQNIGVAIGILLIPVSLILFHKAENINRKLTKIGTYILGILMALLAFGVYQSIILLYILTVVVCYFLKVLKEQDNCWKYLLKQIGIFAIIVVAYFIISKVTGQKASYLQIVWLKDGFSTCLRNIWYVVKDVLKCQSIFYNIGYIIALVAWGMLTIVLIKNKKMKIGLAISTLAIIISPFYIMIITGVNQFYRTQFNYSYAMGVMLMLAVVFLNKEKLIQKIAQWLLIFGVLIVAYIQTYTTANLFNTANIVYHNDVILANKIVEKIEQKEWYDENTTYTLIFVGTYKQKSLNEYIQGEIIGRSFFEFGKEDSTGISGRANIFLEILGYEFKIPTVQQYKEIKDYVMEKDELCVWPSNESITLIDNNTIVIRLSEEIE